ncbi:MAG TPA: vitamin K epoxide reductase family protein [Actinocrinis sp.]|nr:vitamin K epoxide reductase family protein [Actinocrinis sp.]
MSRSLSAAVAAAAAAAAAAEPATGAAVRLPRWIVPSTLLASLAGLGVSIYLTIAHYTTTVTLACPESSTINCERVTTSPESVVFGIPVAVLGLAFFVAMLGLNSPWAWGSAAPLIRRTRLGSAVVGVGFVCWLVYAELFKVDAICLWCTSVHFIGLVLFSLIVIGTAVTSAHKHPSSHSSAAAS